MQLCKTYALNTYAIQAPGNMHLRNKQACVYATYITQHVSMQTCINMHLYTTMYLYAIMYLHAIMYRYANMYNHVY